MSTRRESCSPEGEIAIPNAFGALEKKSKAETTRAANRVWEGMLELQVRREKRILGMLMGRSDGSLPSFIGSLDSSTLVDFVLEPLSLGATEFRLGAERGRLDRFRRKSCHETSASRGSEFFSYIATVLTTR